MPKTKFVGIKMNKVALENNALDPLSFSGLEKEEEEKKNTSGKLDTCRNRNNGSLQI